MELGRKIIDRRTNLLGPEPLGARHGSWDGHGDRRRTRVTGRCKCYTCDGLGGWVHVELEAGTAGIPRHAAGERRCNLRTWCQYMSMQWQAEVTHVVVLQ